MTGDLLAASTYIDHDHPSIRQLAAPLADGTGDARTIAERCFVFVREVLADLPDRALAPWRHEPDWPH